MIIFSIIGIIHDALTMRICCLRGWMLFLILCIDLLIYYFMRDYDTAMSKMEPPPKKTGTAWLILGILMLGMGAAGLVFRSKGIRPLDMLWGNAALHDCPHFDFPARFRVIARMLSGNWEALLFYGAILLVIAFVKKKLRRKQRTSWYHSLNTGKGWYRLQRILVVLLPTLSALLLSDVLAAHLMGIEDIHEKMNNYALFKNTYSPIYTQALAIYFLNYAFTLGLMQYWQKISYIPRSRGSKVRLGLLTLPVVFLLDYLLVRAFYGAMALIIPTIILILVLGCGGAATSGGEEETPEEAKSRRRKAWAWARMQESLDKGDYQGVGYAASDLSWQEKRELEQENSMLYRDERFWHAVHTNNDRTYNG